MFNRTCMRGWFHHKKRVRKKNYARAKKLTGWREPDWYLVKGY